ncbi:hypothetical protein I7I50_00417 [Histoplasma capsulatum G186AR]|uniref:Uncharacterized protein n=1 Tax=Ajellomyces capsulatus TaxID=5037 RepID=A0A8H7YFN4_AJECA|nr:hypothetical protein I7I52_07685 [Histoplasma capsulatum]QSS72545.1 hypothetical protein I7I50_00417 [Histoplasma capsulatum G186AR]
MDNSFRLGWCRSRIERTSKSLLVKPKHALLSSLGAITCPSKAQQQQQAPLRSLPLHAKLSPSA